MYLINSKFIQLMRYFECLLLNQIKIYFYPNLQISYINLSAQKSQRELEISHINKNRMQKLTNILIHNAKNTKIMKLINPFGIGNKTHNEVCSKPNFNFFKFGFSTKKQSSEVIEKNHQAIQGHDQNFIVQEVRDDSKGKKHKKKNKKISKKKSSQNQQQSIKLNVSQEQCEQYKQLSLVNSQSINKVTHSKSEHQQFVQPKKLKKSKSKRLFNKKINTQKTEDFQKDPSLQSAKPKKQSFYKILTQTPPNQNGLDESFLNFLEKEHNQAIKKYQNEQKIDKKQNNKQIKKQKQIVEGKPGKQTSKLFQSTDVKHLNSLSRIVNKVSEDLGFPKVEEFQQNFFYVLDPLNIKEPIVSFGFRYYLFRFCKYQVYFSQHLSPEVFLKMELQMVDTVRYYCLGQKQQEQGLKHLPDPQIDYMQHFLTNLLPFEKTKLFSDIFAEVGIKYFNQLHDGIKLKQRSVEKGQNEELIQKEKPYIPSVSVLYMIQKNLKRLLFDDQLDVEDGEGKQDDYQVYRTLFAMYLDFYCMRKEEFETADRIQCVEIAKFLKIPHAEFMQLIKETIQLSKQNYSTVEFLLMLGYLVENKNTPYQYFYKHKGTWMNIIEAAHDFSDKKTKCCIKFLEIFSRERFVHCETIYFSLLQSIENNLQAMEGKQLVRTLYYYSKARYGSNPRFVSNLVNKILRWLPYLEQNHFSLLVRAIGNLNYQSAELVEKLKNIDYERFLCELKFGCENLGPYYQEILREVELQAKGKVFYEGEQVVVDRNFTPVEESSVAANAV